MRHNFVTEAMNGRERHVLITKARPIHFFPTQRCIAYC